MNKYGKIDHVFANAGIAPTTSLLEEDVDSSGDLLPPNLKTLNVNLTGCLYTVKLAIHHIRKNPDGGSIVITASGSSFTRFPATDYSKPCQCSYTVQSRLTTSQQRPSMQSLALCAL